MGNIGVGLELSFSRLKLVTLEEKKEGLTIINFDTENVTKGETPEEMLQNVNFAVENLLKRNKIKGKLAVSFPSHAIFSRQIKMLPQPEEQLYNTLSFEINEYLPFPVNEAIWSYHKVNRAYNPGEEYDIIVIAAKYEVMEQVEQILGDLIYKVDVLQFAPLALYSYLRYEFADKKETFLVLDIGETNNDMIIIEEGKFWHRSLTLSGKDITKLIVSKMGVTEEEARELKNGELTNELLQTINPFIKNLSTEINRSINFYKYTSKKAVVSEIKLCGSTAKIKNLAKLLQDASLIKTSILDTPQTIYVHPAIEQNITQELLSLYPAIGLALQASHLSEVALNFTPHYVIEYKKFTKKKPLALVGVVLLIVAVVLAYFSFSKKTDMLFQNVTTMQAIVEKNKKTFDDYNNIKNEFPKANLLNYIADMYDKKDRIIHILDALLYSIKTHNLSIPSDQQQNKIYIVGFDYTTFLENTPAPTQDENKLTRKYIKEVNKIYNISIIFASQKEFQDLRLNPIEEIHSKIMQQIPPANKCSTISKQEECPQPSCEWINNTCKPAIFIDKFTRTFCVWESNTCNPIKKQMLGQPKEATCKKLEKKCAKPFYECQDIKEGKYYIYNCYDILLTENDLANLADIVNATMIEQR